MSSKTVAASVTEHDPYFADLDALEFEPPIDLTDPEEDFSAGAPPAPARAASDHVPGSHLEMPTGLRLPFHGGDYSATGAFGSGCVKLIDSGVAPLVVAARGYFTYSDRSPHDLDEAIAQADTYAPRQGSAQAKRLQKMMDNPRDEYGEDILVMPWTGLESWVTFHNGLADDLPPATVQYRASNAVEGDESMPNKYEFTGGKSTPLDVHPGVPLSYRNAPAILIAEGMLKADAALTAYLIKHHGVDALRYGGTTDPLTALSALMDAVPEEDRVLILGIGGVQNWKQCPDWNSLAIKGRKVWLGIDGDTATNLAVWKATNEMKTMLSKKGALVTLLEPRVEGVEKPGIDEYLSREGDWDSLIATATKDLPQAPDKQATVREKARAASKPYAFSGPFGDVPNPALCEEAAKKNRTHFGLAERVLIHYGHMIAYRPAVATFMVYNGTVWVPDVEKILVKGLIRRVIRSITVHEVGFAERGNAEVQRLQTLVDTQLAADAPDPATMVSLKKAREGARADTQRFGEQCENGGSAIDAPLSAIASSTAVEESKWNAHPFLINFPNGTVNLKHRDENDWPILREHDPADRITMVTAVDYLPSAESDDLDEVQKHMDMTGPGTYRCVTRILGYGLTGAMDAKRYLNLYGDPDASKSTLTNAGVLALGGEVDTSYVGTLSPGDLGVDPNGGSGPVVALDACRGKRWVVVAEAEHLYMSSDLVKRWTGGDIIRTRGLYAKGGAWSPSGKFILIGNGPSRFAAHDEGMVNRAVFVKVKPLDKAAIKEGIKYRLEKTVAGQQAVLATLVKAAADWYVDYKEKGMGAADALLVPEHCRVSGVSALEDINPLIDWVEARCIRVNEEDQTTTMEGAAPVSVLHALYNQDARALGLKPMKPREFSKNLSALPFIGEKQTEFPVGNKAYKGRIKTGIRYSNHTMWRIEMGF